MINHVEELRKRSLKNDKLDYLKSLDFPVRVEKKDERIILSIPNLEIREKGNSLDNLLKKVESEKQKYLHNMVEIESEENICFPPMNRPAGFMDFLVSLKELIIQFKFMITFLVLFTLMLKTCSMVGGQVKKSKSRLFEKVQENFDTATPEKTAERKMRMTKFFNFVRPYYIELKKFEYGVEKEVREK